LGLQQKELAKELGVNEMTVVNWEKHEKRPCKSNVKRLVEIFGFNDELIKG
jgi:DNA-binding transcriptional regulator YiaG